MGKISVHNRAGKTVIINRLTYPEAVNERIYNSVTSGMYDYFLPVYMEHKRKDILLECSVQGMQTLTQYFRGTVSKKQFLDIAYKLISIIKSCEKTGLNVNNIELQKDYIFIDPLTKRLRCIYWPVVNNQRGDPPQVHLKELSYDLQFDPDEDNRYLGQYTAFFYEPVPFSIKRFEKMLNRINGKDVLPDVQDETLSRTPFMEAARQEEEENYIVCSVCGSINRGKSKFCYSCGSRLAMSDPLFIEYSIPCLLRNKTGEVFEIDKPVFSIGADPSCDLCISDNDYISRRHADIISKDKRYYVIDLNSMNGILTDGKAISKGIEVEISEGTVLKLADEELIFFKHRVAAQS